MKGTLLNCEAIESYDYPSHFCIQGLKDRFIFFKSELGQYSCAHMYILQVLGRCSFPFPTLAVKKSFLMGFQWKGWGTKSTVLVLCNNAFLSSTKVYMSLLQSELDRQNKWVSSKVTVFLVQNSLFVLPSLCNSSARK